MLKEIGITAIVLFLLWSICIYMVGAISTSNNCYHYCQDKLAERCGEPNDCHTITHTCENGACGFIVDGKPYIGDEVDVCFYEVYE